MRVYGACTDVVWPLSVSQLYGFRCERELTSSSPGAFPSEAAPGDVRPCLGKRGCHTRGAPDLEQVEARDATEHLQCPCYPLENTQPQVSLTLRAAIGKVEMASLTQEGVTCLSKPGGRRCWRGEGLEWLHDLPGSILPCAWLHSGPREHRRTHLCAVHSLYL